VTQELQSVKSSYKDIIDVIGNHQVRDGKRAAPKVASSTTFKGRIVRLDRSRRKEQLDEAVVERLADFDDGGLGMPGPCRHVCRAWDDNCSRRSSDLTIPSGEPPDSTPRGFREDVGGASEWVSCRERNDASLTICDREGDRRPVGTMVPHQRMPSKRERQGALLGSKDNLIIMTQPFIYSATAGTQLWDFTAWHA